MADIKNIKPNQLSGVISGASSILNTAIDLGSINDNYQDDIDQVENQSFSPSSTYSLMNQFNDMNWGDTKSIQDFTGKTGKDYAKGILGATAAGASAGATFGPWGALIGGAVGLVGSGIGAITGGIRGSNALDRYKYQLAQAQDFALGNWNTANTELKTNMFDNSLKSFYRSSAYGGELGTHGSDFTNNLRYINVGGTHEQNPNGGVQMGVDEEGTPNLVEEGEVVFNDYVFSDRLKPSKKALNDSLLGDKYFGKTYAEIAERLAEKSEEMPNDKIEKNTLNANFARLITIQEKQRAKKAEQEANKFEGGGRMTQNEYNNKISEFKRKAHRYASQYAEKGTDNYQKLYDAKFAELSAETEREWAKVKSENESSQKSMREERERLDAIARYLEGNGFKVPKIFDSISKQQIINYNKLDAYYNELINSGTLSPMAGDKDEVSAMEAELEQQYPIEQTKEAQIEAQAEQVAQEVVGQTPSQSSSSASATGSSNPANGSGTRAPIRDGNVVRPDLTNAYVGRGQIQYDRNQNGEAFENQQYYQDFLQYMNSIKGTPEAQAWIDRINSGEFGDMNGYRINSFEDWYRLATDKKVGPVHSATFAAAQLAAQPNTREKIEPILPNSKPLPNEPTLEQAMGVKEEGIHDADRPRIDTYEGPLNEGEDNNWEGLLRYAPVVGNALGLLTNRKDYSDVNRFESMTARPRTVRFTPIGTYIRPNLVAPSEMSTPIQNQMAGERNYISNNSLGNSTVASSYMLASDYLGNARTGAAYLQGKQYNSDQRQRAASYNLGIDQYNSNGAFQEQQANMSLNDYYLRRALASYQMRNNIDMAYNQAKSQNLTALFNNLGNIGLDTFNRNRANEVYPYKYTGWNGDIDFYNS